MRKILLVVLCLSTLTACKEDKDALLAQCQMQRMEHNIEAQRDGLYLLYCMRSKGYELDTARGPEVCKEAKFNTANAACYFAAKEKL